MKYSKLISAFFEAVMLAACTTPNGAVAPAPLQTPAHIAQQVCPPLQTALVGLRALVGLSMGAKADLDAVTPIVAGVCAADATVDVTSLQALQQTALPALVNAVKASGMEVEQQNSLILDITAAQLILSAVKDVNEAATK